jgi:hypothetical protein
MDDNATSVEQGLSAGEMMRRLGTEDYYAKGAAHETLCTNDSRLIPRARRP